MNAPVARLTAALTLALVVAVALGALGSASCAPVAAQACATSVDCGGAACVLNKDGARLCDVARTSSASLSVAPRPSFTPIAARGRSLALRGSLSVTQRSPR